MNRFESEPHTLNKNHDRDEDGFPCLQCQYCNGQALMLVPAPWDTTLLVCDSCANCDLEPECECRQTDVDVFDPRGCEFHDSTSPWNVHRRAMERVQMLDEAGVTKREAQAYTNVFKTNSEVA